VGVWEWRVEAGVRETDYDDYGGGGGQNGNFLF